MTAVSLPPERPLRPTDVIRMLGNETAKGLRVLWSHRATVLPQVAMLGGTYLLFQLVLGGGRLVDALLPATLFAYSFYVINYVALMKMVAGVMEEVNTGTFEQAHLGPVPAWVMSLGRLGAVFVEGVLTAGIIAAVLALVLGIDMPLRLAALVPLVLTLIDIAGFALLIAGLALVVNSIGAIIHLVNGALMMVNGSVVPISAFPAGLELAAKFVPTTLGIDVTREVMFNGQTLAAVWADYSLPLALLHAAVMLLAGWAAYQAAIARGLREGRLGP